MMEHRRKRRALILLGFALEATERRQQSELVDWQQKRKRANKKK
jgi:hypothetical protein